MEEKIIIAGSGGQGIMVLGKVLATAAMITGKATTWLPAYGAEVRGGTAYCMTIISDREIGFPYIEQADTGIIMNGPSFERFRSRVCRGGLLILNRSLIPAAPGATGERFTDLALEIGDIKVANMIALGYYLARRPVVAAAAIVRAMESIAPADKRGLLELNRRAFERGREAAQA